MAEGPEGAGLHAAHCIDVSLLLPFHAGCSCDLPNVESNCLLAELGLLNIAESGLNRC